MNPEDLENKVFALEKRVKEFEDAFAEKVGAKYADFGGNTYKWDKKHLYIKKGNDFELVSQI